MGKMLKGVLVKVDGTNEIVEIEDTLDNLYKVCNCSCIDIVVRKIKGKPFDIVLDDEGLLKTDFQISAVREDYRETLVGNLLIVKNDGKGNLKSLNQEEIDLVRGSINEYGVLVIDKPSKEDIKAMEDMIKLFGGNVIKC